MQNVLDTVAQVGFLWDGFFAVNSSNTMASNSLATMSSFGNLQTTGIENAAFSHSAGGKAVCVTGLVDVPIVANTSVINYEGPADNFELTEFITSLTRKDSAAFATYLGGPSQVSDSFSIFSKLCVPNDISKASKLSSVQFLTHGGTLDHGYWDFDTGYSYVDAAAEKGYATFSYDRLGTGKSDHPDPKQVVQVPLQVDLAHALVQKVKNGSLGGIQFTHVIGVGHSLGSAITQGIASKYPDDVDAIILTGHSQGSEGSWAGFAASAQQIASTLPDRPELKELPNGYFTLGPISQTLQFAFFYYPFFDPAIFMKNFNTRQTNAIGETLTLGGFYLAPTEYTKPVQILNGIQDYYYCAGNCLAGGADATLAALHAFFPNRDKEMSQAVNVDDIGHNINMHLKRTEAFEKMLGFVANLGVKP